MSVYAQPRGVLYVPSSRALRLAWGLATEQHPWEQQERELPLLPGNVKTVHDIPRALAFWRQSHPAQTQASVRIEAASFVWESGPRCCRIEEGIRYARLSEIRWESGADHPCPFFGPLLIAAGGCADVRLYAGLLSAGGDA